MSLRELVDPECGGANPLMRLGSHLMQDAAHKDDGVSGLPTQMPGGPQFASQPIGEGQLVGEFLGQMHAPPPQTFRMDALLQEMRDIDARNNPAQLARAPAVADEINKGAAWISQFHSEHAQSAHIASQNELFKVQQTSMPPTATQENIFGAATTRHFFDEAMAGPSFRSAMPPAPMLMNRVNFGPPMGYTGSQMVEDRAKWSAAYDAIGLNETSSGDWVKDFEEHKVSEGKTVIDLAVVERFNLRLLSRAFRKETRGVQHPFLAQFAGRVEEASRAERGAAAVAV